MKEKILLYSGGLDSLCAKEILEKEIDDLESVYFDFKTPYRDMEIEKLENIITIR